MTPGQNKKKTVFGVVSVTGRLYYSIQPRKRAVNFLAFLKHLLRRVATRGQLWEDKTAFIPRAGWNGSRILFNQRVSSAGH